MARVGPQDETVWVMRTDHVAGHLKGDLRTGTSVCGLDLSKAVVSTLLACQAHRIVLCGTCWPGGNPFQSTP